MDKQGFDLSQGIWQDSGWQEVEDLRRKLEALTELRELVRSLGRAGGKGPLRRAPEEVRCAWLVKRLHPAVIEPFSSAAGSQKPFLGCVGAGVCLLGRGLVARSGLRRGPAEKLLLTTKDTPWNSASFPLGSSGRQWGFVG